MGQPPRSWRQRRPNGQGGRLIDDLSESHEIVLTPDWEVTCEWFARALSEHAFDRFAREPVVAFIEQVRYLALTDPEALTRVLARITRQAHGKSS